MTATSKSDIIILETRGTKQKKKEVESKMKNFVDVVAVMLVVCFMVFGAFIVWAVIANSISWGVSVNVPALVAGLLVFAFGAYMF